MLLGPDFSNRAVCQARKFNVIVHVGHGVRRLPMEVSLVLDTYGACACADVNKDGAFHSSSDLLLLPTPFQGEAVLEV